MRLFLLLAVSCFCIPARAQSPLSDFSKEWNDPKYKICNTAANASYMTEKEKEVIYILNLARMDPKLFRETVVTKYPEAADEPGMESSPYFLSLLSDMDKMQPIALLGPDSLCFVSAFCHASVSGKTGYVGHTRTKACNAVKYYSGECCDYGNSTALDIVLSLMIDERVESLGHRKACFNTYYKVIGVSIQPHKIYNYNTVLDFKG